jgi:hypothetical protein
MTIMVNRDKMDFQWKSFDIVIVETTETSTHPGTIIPTHFLQQNLFLAMAA